MQNPYMCTAFSDDEDGRRGGTYLRKLQIRVCLLVGKYHVIALPLRRQNAQYTRSEAQLRGRHTDRILGGIIEAIREHDIVWLHDTAGATQSTPGWRLVLRDALRRELCEATARYWYAVWI